MGDLIGGQLLTCGLQGQQLGPLRCEGSVVVAADRAFPGFATFHHGNAGDHEPGDGVEPAPAEEVERNEPGEGGDGQPGAEPGLSGIGDHQPRAQGLAGEALGPSQPRHDDDGLTSRRPQLREPMLVTERSAGAVPGRSRAGPHPADPPEQADGRLAIWYWRRVGSYLRCFGGPVSGDNPNMLTILLIVLIVLLLVGGGGGYYRRGRRRRL